MGEIAKENFIDKLIDRIFSIRKVYLYLIGIFILGFVLRLIAAINLSVSADGMHFVLHAIDFYQSNRLITYDQSSGLWFAFTSIIYDIFGINQLTSRMAALIFGSFSVLIIYLLAKEFFDEKIGLISAFLLAIAPFHIKNTVEEMDVMTMFFVLTSMLIFIRALKSEKKAGYLVSGIFMGLAVYTKVYPLLFIPSLLLYSVYLNKKEKKKILSGENVKRIAIFLFAIFIFTIPALTHNYLLYKEKGFMDLQFTRTFGLGRNISEKYYGWDYQFNAKNDWKGLIFGNSQHSSTKKPTIISAFEFIMRGNPIAFFLGLFGMFIIFFSRKEYKNYIVFFVLSILLVLPFLASIILLPKHYIFLEVLFIPAGGLAIDVFSRKFEKLKSSSGKYIYFIIIIFAFYYLGLTSQTTLGATHFYGKNHLTQMIELKEKIPDNALIVADSRIYRGRIHWAFYGKPYLEANELVNLFAKKDEIPGNEVPVEIYFFECILDDCGWGTVKDNQELNTSMESITSFFQSGGKLIGKISEPYEDEPYYPGLGKKIDIINVYKTKIPLKEAILQYAKQPKEWFLYPIGYKPKDKLFDNYNAVGLGALLDKIAHFIVLSSLILTFLSPIYVVYLIRKK